MCVFCVLSRVRPKTISMNKKVDFHRNHKIIFDKLSAFNLAWAGVWTTMTSSLRACISAIMTWHIKNISDKCHSIRKSMLSVSWCSYIKYLSQWGQDRVTTERTLNQTWLHRAWINVHLHENIQCIGHYNYNAANRK